MELNTSCSCFTAKFLLGTDHVHQDTEGPVTWNRWRKCGVCISWNQQQLHVYSKQGISSNLELKTSNKYINEDLCLVILHPKSLFSLRSINADLLNKTHLHRLLTHAKHGAEQTFQLIFRIQCFKHNTVIQIHSELPRVKRLKILNAPCGAELVLGCGNLSTSH